MSDRASAAVVTTRLEAPAEASTNEALWGSTCVGCGTPFETCCCDADWPEMCQLCREVIKHRPDDTPAGTPPRAVEATTHRPGASTPWNHFTPLAAELIAAWYRGTALSEDEIRGEVDDWFATTYGLPLSRAQREQRTECLRIIRDANRPEGGAH